uniref:Uncharacterized protein n=1 Tax=Rhizophora mucronata TaxID=61149 RepID=A0A2P2QEW9_RHIMU
MDIIMHIPSMIELETIFMLRNKIKSKH